MTEQETFSLVPASDPGREILEKSGLAAVPQNFRQEEEWFDRDRDLVMPRVKLLQQMSAECQPDPTSGKAPLVDGALPGKWFHTLTKRVLESPVSVIVVSTFKTAHYFGQDPSDACHSADMENGSLYGACETCRYSWKKWIEKDGKRFPPLCSETINFLALIEGASPAAIAFMRTGLKVAREFVSQKRALLSGFLRNWWDRPVLLGRTIKQNAAKQTYYVPVLSFDTERVSDELTRRLAYECYLSMKGKRIRTDLETEEERPGNAAPF